MDKVKVVLFLVVILGIIIYIFSSGVIGSLGRQFQALTRVSSSSNSLVVRSETSGKVATAGQVTSTTPVATTTINPADIPPGFTVSQLSPYFHKIRFSGISAGGPGYYGVITIYSNLNQGETVDVTGWQIKSNKGGEYIPQAVALYDPSGLAPASDIVLQTGQYVYMYSSAGPFNLRLNKCIGYIGNSNHFTPPLPNYCPSPDRSAISTFTGVCQNFIQSIGSCQTPDLNNPQIPNNDQTCRDYIANNFNYRSCFNAHESDPDFFLNQWWIWTGASPSDPYHDVVDLLDKHGLLVDIYTY